MADFKTIQASNSGELLTNWLAQNTDRLLETLREEGAVLLRGFETKDRAILAKVLESFGSSPMEDARWSSPRTSIGEGAFTASEYPPDQTIVLHSEMSYARQWPRLLTFQCGVPADVGGATTVCNIDIVSEALDDLLEEFFEREVLYIRNFRAGIDVPWQDAFGTNDKSEVEAISESHQVETEWLSDGTLRTYQQAQGAVTTSSGRPLFFNQAHLFHPSQLGKEVRKTLSDAFGTEGLPRNAVFGDGEPLSDAVVERVLSVLTENTQSINWQSGDVAVIDNMRWMHGRAPFSGDRSVFVAMGMAQSDPVRDEIQI